MNKDTPMQDAGKLTRDWFIEQDRGDPLASFRNEFDVPDGMIYLDGNSLGPVPSTAMQRAREVIEKEWGTDLIKSWNTAGWFELPTRLGDKLAPLIGADSGEVVVTDSTSINLCKVLSAALAMRPGRTRVILEGSNFPTNNYIAQGLERWSGAQMEVVLCEKDEIAAAIDERTAAVCITHVHYKTGHIHDMAAITQAAHEAGALAIWDLCHSAGALPVDLNGCDVDFAIGCTYKYLNGGPGSPAFIFAARRHHAQARQPLSGWWGHSAPFAFDRQFEPAADIRRFLTGTQPIISLSLAELGLDIATRADIDLVRAKSQALTGLFIQLVEERCAGFGFELATPRDPEARGSQVSFSHADGYPIMRALIDRGVIGDFRAPDTVRFGFAPLYLRYVDIWEAVETLMEIMAEEIWKRPEYSEREAVT
ncbi:MAG: kynureninase [Erythrobacter sp.]